MNWRYEIMPAAVPPRLTADWSAPWWRHAPVVTVDRFRPESSAHRPSTQARVVHDATGLWGIFRVADRFVRCRHNHFQAPVCEDSCVEFFVAPKPGAGYLNFEFNCGGALCSSYIRDPTRTGLGFRDYEPLSEALGNRVGIAPSTPGSFAGEHPEPELWTLGFHIPFGLFEHYVGALNPMSDQGWRGNFYKCADRSSHPHWASWAPVSALNFHLPQCFGELVLTSGP